MGEQFKIIEYYLIILFIMYANTSSSILSDIVYKTEGSSNDDTDKDGTDNNDEAYKEEESHETEEAYKEESHET